MKTNKKGLDLIKKSEGLSLKAYLDPATGGEPITIGYGHTGGVKITDKIKQEQANQFLQKDLERFEKGVTELVKVSLTSNQFSALVCFSFNLGLGNLKISTLLKLLNANKIEQVPQEFLKWNKANGKEMKGLTVRRLAESNLFKDKENEEI